MGTIIGGRLVGGYTMFTKVCSLVMLRRLHVGGEVVIV